MGQGCLRRESAWRRLYFLPDAPLLSARHRITITDPTSGERAWVCEQYPVPAAGRTTTQTAMATTPTRLAAEPARPHPVPSVKKRVRLPRPGVRMPDGFASAQFDRRWERHAERRGGFGLFFFGRFARA